MKNFHNVLIAMFQELVPAQSMLQCEMAPVLELSLMLHGQAVKRKQNELHTTVQTG